MNPAWLTTESIRRLSWGEAAIRILGAALAAVEPARAVARYLTRDGDRLWVGEYAFTLARFRRLRLVAVGKASLPMAEAVQAVLGDRLSDGLVISKASPATHPARKAGGGEIVYMEAGHPIPDQRNLQAARALERFLAGSREDDLVLCLISGGGSALLSAPVEGLGLADIQQLTQLLLHSGATIQEINTLRKHLERLKGGRLAQLATPARLITLVLSDVVGDPLSVIASGPTVPDPTTYQDAWEILAGYDLLDQVSASIRQVLAGGMAGKLPETPKPGAAIFTDSPVIVVANNQQAARAALEQAKSEGYNPCLLTSYLQGEARQAGGFLASIARQVVASGEPIPRPACLIAGGETTVSVTGNGMGGRNQELALGAVSELAGLAEVLLIAFATDGGDGPDDAAGATVTGDTLQRARQAGLSPETYLNNNDAYHFFDPLGDLIKCGATHTNVNDLAILLVR
jgi:hydroxypyruvate reductase